jgi:hypothetical protein
MSKSVPYSAVHEDELITRMDAEEALATEVKVSWICLILAGVALDVYSPRGTVRLGISPDSPGRDCPSPAVAAAAMADVTVDDKDGRQGPEHRPTSLFRSNTPLCIPSPTAPECNHRTCKI